MSISEKLAKDTTRGIKRGVEEINKTISGKVQEIMATVDSHKNISYNTDELLKLMKNEIKGDANEYANKVRVLKIIYIKCHKTTLRKFNCGFFSHKQFTKCFIFDKQAVKCLKNKLKFMEKLICTT